jgi:hypothetical protein
MSDAFKKSCGDFELIVSPPSPRWVKINWDGRELVGSDGFENCPVATHIKIDDLRDLQYLIARALEAVA